MSLLVDGEEQDSVIMSTIYIDDLIVAASGNAKFIWLEGKLGSQFEHTTAQADSVYLTLTQRGCAKKTLEKFGMAECCGAKTLVDPTAILSLADCPAEIKADLVKEYLQKVDNLEYLSTMLCRFFLVTFMCQDLRIYLLLIRLCNISG